MDSREDVAAPSAGAAFLRRARSQVASQFAVRASAARRSMLADGGRLEALIDELAISLRRQRVFHLAMVWIARGPDAAGTAPVDPLDFDVEAVAAELALLRRCIIDLLEIHDVDISLREIGLIAEWFDAVLMDVWRADGARQRETRGPRSRVGGADGGSPDSEETPSSPVGETETHALRLLARIAPRRVMEGEGRDAERLLGHSGGYNLKAP